MANLLEGDFPLALLSTASGDEAVVLALIDEGLLAHGRKVGMVHRVATPAANAGSADDTARRRSHFAALAAAAEALRLPELETARYFEEACLFQQSRAHYIRAGEKACLRMDYPSALKALKCAIAIWPWNEDPGGRLRILRETARCAMNANDRSTARSIWQEVADFASDHERADLRAEALSTLASLSEDIEETNRLLREAALLAAERLPADAAVRHLMEYVEHLASRVRTRQAIQMLALAVDRAEALGNPATLSEVRGWQGLLAAMSGAHDAAAGWVKESLRLAIDHGLTEQVALAYRRQANIREYRSDYAGEKEMHRSAIRICRDSQTTGELSCLSCLSYACFRTGDWKDAMHSAREVLRGQDADRGLRAVATCVLGLISAFRGERANARQHLDTALRELRVCGITGLEFFALQGLGFLCSIDGEVGEAGRIHDEIRALWSDTDDVHDAIPGLLFAGVHYAEQGQADRLAGCIDALSSMESRNSLEEARTARATLGAEHARLLGDSARYARTLSESIDRYAQLGLPVELAWVGCRLARNAPGPESEAARSRALATARRLGLRPMLACLQARMGTDERPLDLTPRQLEVIRLLAHGLTSKEMADRLGLSVRTVEMHVGRLLERLDCRTRPEAVRLATERGWIQPG